RPQIERYCRVGGVGVGRVQDSVRLSFQDQETLVIDGSGRLESGEQSGNGDVGVEETVGLNRAVQIRIVIRTPERLGGRKAARELVRSPCGWRVLGLHGGGEPARGGQPAE